MIPGVLGMHEITQDENTEKVKKKKKKASTGSSHLGAGRGGDWEGAYEWVKNE